MRVLVCGGRDADASEVWRWLEHCAMPEITDALSLYKRRAGRITAIIHGGALGADEGAGYWAHGEGIPAVRFPANWRKHGKAAGPIRNAKMIADGKPDVVIAFPGGRGTADMIRQAEAAGVPVIRATGVRPSPALSASVEE